MTELEGVKGKKVTTMWTNKQKDFIKGINDFQNRKWLENLLHI